MILESLHRQAVQPILQCLVLENVPQLAVCGAEQHKSNLDEVIHQIRAQLGFATVVFLLDAMVFGMCQNRERLWLVCYPVRELERLGISEEEAELLTRGWMGRLSGSQLTPWTG